MKRVNMCLWSLIAAISIHAEVIAAAPARATFSPISSGNVFPSKDAAVRDINNKLAAQGFNINTLGNAGYDIQLTTKYIYKGRLRAFAGYFERNMELMAAGGAVTWKYGEDHTPAGDMIKAINCGVDVVSRFSCLASSGSFNANLLGAASSQQNYKECMKNPAKRQEEQSAIGAVKSCVVSFSPKLEAFCDVSKACNVTTAPGVNDLLRNAVKVINNESRDISAAYNMRWGYVTKKK